MDEIMQQFFMTCKKFGLERLDNSMCGSRWVWCRLTLTPRYNDGQPYLVVYAECGLRSMGEVLPKNMEIISQQCADVGKYVARIMNGCQGLKIKVTERNELIKSDQSCRYIMDLI